VITDYSITLGEPQTTFEIKRLDSNSFSVTVSSPTGPAGALQNIVHLRRGRGADESARRQHIAQIAAFDRQAIGCFLGNAES
jgi:hypothetical protein